MHPHDPLVELFRLFVDAVLAGDATAFARLCSDEAGDQKALFERNSLRIRNAGWRLLLDAIVQEGGVAEIRYAVVKGRDDVVDRASLSCVQTEEGWRIASL